ncbi:MAG: outer membrane protein assembly factor BamA [Deltaproteobacteria bacterium]|nr:outer membrane protein assembly factor BamA [Deltaproteobacteria bacterium]
MIIKIRGKGPETRRQERSGETEKRRNGEVNSSIHRFTRPILRMGSPPIRFCFVLLLLTACLLLMISTATVAGGDNSTIPQLPNYATPRVIIMPFTIHSKDNLSVFRRDILNAMASVIEADGKVEIVGIERLKRLILEEKVYLFDESLALRIGKEEGTSFAIVGSITKIDKTMSLDIRLLDTPSGRIISSAYVKGDSEKETLESAVSIAKDLQNKIIESKARSQESEVRISTKQGIIARIIITGNKRVDEDAVKAKIKSKAGEPLSSDDLRDDIKAVYDMGFFEDVTADIADTGKGMELNFIVKERPIIKKVNIEGNKEISTEKITAAITIKENTILNRTLLMENAEKIKALYAADGFYLAKVEPVVDRKADAIAEVKFKIEEGDKVKVKRITVIGSKAYHAAEIKDIMDTKEVGFFSFMTKAGIFDEAVFQNDLNKIMAHYYDNGYIHASITDHLVSLSSDKRWFFITIALFEGEQYKVGKIDIKGDILTTRDELMEKVKITSDEIFSRKILNADISRLSDVYGDKGYANVNINPVTDVDTKEKRVDITFDIHKGDLVYIEKINISGNVNTRDKVIRREIELPEGTLFSSSSMKRSRNNLRRLGYFEAVNITAQPGSSESRMILNVDVKERPTGQISAGIGYSSVDNIIGTASISQSNFLGTGLKLELSGTVSSKSEKYQLGFTEPWLFDKPISAGFDIFKTGRVYPDFTRDSYGFDIRTGFPVYERDVRGYLTYKLEVVTVKDVASNAAELIKEQEGKKSTSSISGVLRRDTRDDAFFPTEGSVTSLSAEYAGGLLGGDNNFVKYIVDGIKYFPLFWDTTFTIRGVMGYVQGLDGKNIPVYERFYLGGINTIRGFKTRGIGPKDSVTNEVIGGDTEIFTNLEYLFPLVKEQMVKGLIFFDAGNAFNGEINFGNLRTSAGLGIRWFSPVGPLRLEWGYVLDRRAGEDSSQWEFTIGTMF